MVINAAIKKYNEAAGGFEFYYQRIASGKTRISSDGMVTLFSSNDGSELAQYQLDELEIPPQIANALLAELCEPADKPCDGFVTIESDKRFLYSIAAVASIVLGLFAPIVSLPFKGSINYLAGGRGDGMIVLALAIASTYLLLKSDFRKLLYTGVASLIVIFTGFFYFQLTIGKAIRTMNSTLEGNPFRGLADAAMSSVGIEWGWLFLISGSVGLMVVSKLKKNDGYFTLPLHCIRPFKGSISENIPIIIALSAAVGFIISNLIDTWL